MTEKAVVLSSRTAKTKTGSILAGGAWAAAGLLMEVSSGGGSVGASALAAGVTAANGIWIYAGGIVGALLKGFPGGYIGIGGLAIVLAGRLIPQVRNVRIKCVIQGLLAAAAAFFPACAEYTSPSALLSGIISAFTAGIFAACVLLLYDRASVRGFDISDPGDCALGAIAAGIAFMSLGGLELPFCNVGRLLAGFLLLAATERKGVQGAVLGIPAVCGLCISGGTNMPRVGVIALAAVTSCFLSRYGRITRAVGYLFFGCAGILAGAVMEGSWSIFAELAAGGTAFVLIPAKFISGAEAERTDIPAARVLRERLNFAAGAVEGVNTGLEAAADTLERRYSASLIQVADNAADRACRCCPNNMICWGQKYELFHGEFERLVKQLRTGGEISEQSMNPLAAAECVNRPGVIAGVRRAYEQYLRESGEQKHIKELRRLFSEQLGAFGEILRDMGGAAGKLRAGSRTAERRAEKVLQECGLTETSAFVTFAKGGRLRLEAYGSGSLNSDREYLGELLIRALGRELDLPEVSTSGGRVRVTASQRAAMSAEVGVCQLCRGKNRVCGDCCDSFTDPSGALYVVLSDGMGSGSRARIDSALACSLTSRLIKSGISLSAVLETVNTSLMVKSADESFATLDICRIDLNSGEAVIYKAGAAATYIKSGDRMSRAVLSSQPIGSGGSVTVPAQKFHVTAGDIVVMTTDGAFLDEEWLSRELSRELPAKGGPQELSERIAHAARNAENGREDDISIITVVIGR